MRFQVGYRHIQQLLLGGIGITDNAAIQYSRATSHYGNRRGHTATGAGFSGRDHGADLGRTRYQFLRKFVANSLHVFGYNAGFLRINIKPRGIK